MYNKILSKTHLSERDETFQISPFVCEYLLIIARLRGSSAPILFYYLYVEVSIPATLFR